MPTPFMLSLTLHSSIGSPVVPVVVVVPVAAVVVAVVEVAVVVPVVGSLVEVSSPVVVVVPVLELPSLSAAVPELLALALPSLALPAVSEAEAEAEAVIVAVLVADSPLSPLSSPLQARRGAAAAAKRRASAVGRFIGELSACGGGRRKGGPGRASAPELRPRPEVARGEHDRPSRALPRGPVSGRAYASLDRR
jgi:hypothetical protein